MKHLSGLSLTVLLATGGLSAEASTFTETLNFSVVESVVDSSANNVAATEGGSLTVGSIPNFDNSLGTLTGVRIEYSGNLTFSSALVNVFGGPVFGQSSASAQFFLDLDGNGVVGGDEGLSAGGSLTANLSCSVASFDPCDTSSSLGTLNGDSFTAAEWDFLTSGTSFDLKFNYDISAELTSGFGASISTGINFSDGNSESGDGKVTVFYDFDPTDTPPAVPLPAGMPLLLAGLGGFALVRRSKVR